MGRILGAPNPKHQTRFLRVEREADHCAAMRRADHGFPRGQNPGNRTRSSPDRVVNTQRCRAIVVLLPQSAGRSLAFLPSFARLASFHLFIKGAFFSISSNSSLASSGV